MENLNEVVSKIQEQIDLLKIHCVLISNLSNKTTEEKKVFLKNRDKKIRAMFIRKDFRWDSDESLNMMKGEDFYSLQISINGVDENLNFHPDQSEVFLSFHLFEIDKKEIDKEIKQFSIHLYVLQRYLLPDRDKDRDEDDLSTVCKNHLFCDESNMIENIEKLFSVDSLLKKSYQKEI